MSTSTDNDDAAAKRRLLIVHHTPSPGMQAMLEAVQSGAGDEQIRGVEVLTRPALTTSVVDALEADAYIVGTPVNIGYMSGALKHFFDQVYYPALEATRGRPFGFYVHGNEGLEGGIRSIQSIASALGWNLTAPPVEVLGAPTKTDLEACSELGAILAATIMPEA